MSDNTMYGRCPNGGWLKSTYPDPRGLIWAYIYTEISFVLLIYSGKQPLDNISFLAYIDAYIRACCVRFVISMNLYTKHTRASVKTNVNVYIYIYVLW